MKKFLQLVVVFCVVVGLAGCASADYWNEGHSGTAADPYVIDTNADLVALRDRVNAGTESGDKYYRLTQNLTISSITDWDPIGYNDRPFTGHFDGNNLAIHVNMTAGYHHGNYYAGLFGTVSTTEGYAVRNLTVSGSAAGRYVGGIVRRLNSGSVENCAFNGTVKNNHAYEREIGGIVSYMAGGSVKNSFMSGNVDITDGWSNYKTYAGAIVARMTGGSIENCNANGVNVVVNRGNKEGYVGGLVGYAEVAGFDAIKDCTFSGTVAGLRYVGGIAGYISGGNVQNCSVTAVSNANSAVASTYIAGGIAGRAGNSVVIENCEVASGTVIQASTESDRDTAEAAGGIIGLMESATTSNNTSRATIQGDTANLGGVVGKLNAASYTIDGNRYSSAEHGIGSNAQGVPGEDGCTRIDSALSITTTSLTAADAGTFYSFTLQTDASAGTSVTWSMASGTSLPDGLALNASTGVISGTPTTAGKYTFTVQANSGSSPATKELTLTVNLVITTNAVLPSGTVGTSYSQSLSATGARSVTWSLSQGNTLPAGLSLSNGRISGTPTVSGTSQFTLIASAGTDITASRTFTLTINPSGTVDPTPTDPTPTDPTPVTPTPTVSLTITTSSLPSGTAGERYSSSLSSNPSGASWSLSGGTLPNGLTLSSSGTISGTPTATGTFTFTVRAASGSSSATRNLSITINAPELRITTSSLPYGMVGYYYDETLSANLSGVTWSVYSGSLPYGLSLSSSGEIYGTPTYYGTYDFTVQAQGTYSSTTKSFRITIYDPDPEPEPYPYPDPDPDEPTGGGGCNSGFGLAGLILLAGLALRKSHR